MATKELRAVLRKAFGTGDPKAIVGRPFSFSFTRYDKKKCVYLGTVSGVEFTYLLDGNIGMVTCRPIPSSTHESFEGFSIELWVDNPVWRFGVTGAGTEGKLQLL